jgi:hypothetical protein
MDMETNEDDEECETHNEGDGTNPTPSSSSTPSGKKPIKVQATTAGSAEAKTRTADQQQRFSNNKLWVTYNRDWPQCKRDKLSHKDFAGPHQSFPITTQEDVDSAAKLIGHADDPNAVKARIKAIAKRKGLNVPESWQDKTTDNKQGDNMILLTNAELGVNKEFSTDTERRAAFAAMAADDSSAKAGKASSNASKANKANKSAAHGRAAEAHKSAMKAHLKAGNKKLASFHKKAMNEHKAMSAKTATQNSEEKTTVLNESLIDNLITNGCMCGTKRQLALKVLNAKKEDDEEDDMDDEDEEDEEYERNDDDAKNIHSFDQDHPVKGGSQQAGGKGTEDEYNKNPRETFNKRGPITNRLTLAELEVWNSAVEVNRQRKLEIVRQLVSNVSSGKQRKVIGDKLMKKPISELQEMLALMPPVQNHAAATANEDDGAIYLGANGGVFNRGGPADFDKNDILPIPTLNFGEESGEAS